MRTRSSALAYTPNPVDATVLAMVGRINRYRQSRRLPDLEVSAVLCGTAQEWASRMAASRHLFHGDPPERLAEAGVLRNVASGECIAMGCDVDEVMGLWTDDAPHRAILLGGYERAGVGMTVGEDGWGYWCLDVAAGQD